MRKSVWISCIAAVAAFGSGIGGLSADQLWSVHGGNSVILLDFTALSELGLRAESTDPDNYPAPYGQVRLPIAGDTDTMALLTGDSAASAFANGTVHHVNGLVLIGPRGRVVIDDLAVGAVAGSTGLGTSTTQLSVVTSHSSFDDATNRLAVQCDELKISRQLASDLGIPAAAGRSIGSLQSSADLSYMGGDDSPAGDDLPVPHDCTNPTTGPDVIVGDIGGTGGGISNYSPVGGIDAISLGTISCNIGNAQLQWVSDSVNHPVIPQNAYRLKTVNGSARFEQVGQGWMKHAFTALSQNLCCTCGAGGGVTLGIGCSDPYTSGRNGSQVTPTGGCGPKFEVNAHSGGITWPYTFRNQALPETSITRRCQILESDLDPLQNSGALYFGEAQYVTPDDAAARNQNNNCSYRRMTVSGTLASHNLACALAAATVRMKAAIQAWKDTDSSVTETIVTTAEATPPSQPLNTTGRLILSAQATDLGGGQWHYEYALFNMNSDRGVSVFSVPTGTATTVSNTGFHDAPYHSGDGFGSAIGALKNIDGTDWPVVVGATSVHWDCVPLVAPADPRNTNYLRWGTMYNYRFDCNVPPSTGNVTLSYWKAVAGQPDSIQVSTVVPLAACDAPVINAIAPQNASCGSAFTSLTPSTSGTSPFAWSILSGGQPGMTIAPTTGVVSWPSPVASATAYNLTLQAASNCSAAVDTEEMSVTVPFAIDPVIDPIAPQNATCGSAFTSAMPTGTGLAGAVWSIALGGQPGMTINSSGVISWPSPVPNASPYNVTIQATNACAVVPSDTEVVSINAPFAADPVIDSVPPQNGACGTAFTSATPTGSGLAGASWSITLGGQPGMTINSSGVISWPTPAPSALAYDVTIQASHPCSANPGTTVVSISISAESAPTVNPIPPGAAYCGQLFSSFFPVVNGGTPPYTWSLMGAPVGMTIDPGNGQITWPSPVASPTPYNITVQVSYACGAGPGSATFILTVLLGDFDLDGVVSATDVPYFIDHLLGNDVFSPCTADMNADGFLDGLDVQGFVGQL